MKKITKENFLAFALILLIAADVAGGFLVLGLYQHQVGIERLTVIKIDALKKAFDDRCNK